MVTTVPQDSQDSQDLNAYSHRDKPLWNGVALVYVIGGYTVGIALLIASNGWLNALGTMLVAHTLFLSAVLTHEFMHSTIFADQRWNELGGNLMLWINGGCYARFRDLTRWHIAHHEERADFPAVDIATFVQALPRFLQTLVFTLEWLYFPSVAFLMQWRALTGPFWNPERQDERRRTTILLIIRTAMFIGLALLSWKALLLYGLTYVGMHLQMQLFNSFFHTYEPFSSEMKVPHRDWAYEQLNTFSCLLSQRYPWLNLLVLNFGYHNAHHAVMRCPWHSLPELDRDLSPIQSQASSHRFSLRQVLGNYHRYRLTRILSGHGHIIDEQGHYSLDSYYGDVGVGFMILPV
jgi:fatty acid desaturase